MRRPGLVLATTVVLALAAAGAGTPHGPRFAPGYISSVHEIRPVVPGLTARVLDGDTLISVRNWSNRTVVVLDTDGRPLFRFASDGVSRRTSQGWRLVKRGTSHTWHDSRIHWGAANPPPVVARAPEQRHRIRSWRIPGTVDGEPIAIHGSLGWVPVATASASVPDDDLPGWVIPLVVLTSVAAMGALAATVLRGKRTA